MSSSSIGAGCDLAVSERQEQCSPYNLTNVLTFFFFFCMQQAVTAMGTHLALKTSVIELASNSIESTCMGVGHWISLL